MNEQARSLIECAIAAAMQAYAPYSEFCVGAALETESGEVFAGVNVENVSLGLTICAERAAVATAVAAGKRCFRAIAIVSPQAKRPLLPCGACLQVLSEFVDDLVIYTRNLDGAIEETHLKALLPQAFTR